MLAQVHARICSCACVRACVHKSVCVRARVRDCQGSSYSGPLSEQAMSFPVPFEPPKAANCNGRFLHTEEDYNTQVRRDVRKDTKQRKPPGRGRPGPTSFRLYRQGSAPSSTRKPNFPVLMVLPCPSRNTELLFLMTRSCCSSAVFELRGSWMAMVPPCASLLVTDGKASPALCGITAEAWMTCGYVCAQIYRRCLPGGRVSH